MVFFSVLFTKFNPEKLNAKYYIGPFLVEVTIYLLLFKNENIFYFLACLNDTLVFILILQLVLLGRNFQEFLIYRKGQKNFLKNDGIN